MFLSLARVACFLRSFVNSTAFLALFGILYRYMVLCGIVFVLHPGCERVWYKRYCRVGGSSTGFSCSKGGQRHLIIVSHMVVFLLFILLCWVERFRVQMLRLVEAWRSIHFQRNDHRGQRVVPSLFCERGLLIEPARTASSMIATGSCVDKSE